MKRGFFLGNIISVVCLFCFAMPASGQDFIKTLDVYFIIGPSFSMDRGSYLDNSNFSASYPVMWHQTTKVGYSLGLGIQHTFSKHISLSTRLLFEQKGGNATADNYNYNYNSGQPIITYMNTFNDDITNSYITLSIIPQYIFWRNFNLGVGIFSGVMYKSEEEKKYFNYSPPIPPNHSNSMYAFEKIDFGLCFNAGYTIRYKQVNLTVQFTNNYGLKNTIVSTQVSPVYSNTYTILLGISYDKLTKKLFRKQNP